MRAADPTQGGIQKVCCGFDREIHQFSEQRNESYYQIEVDPINICFVRHVYRIRDKTDKFIDRCTEQGTICPRFPIIQKVLSISWPGIRKVSNLLKADFLVFSLGPFNGKSLELFRHLIYLHHIYHQMRGAGAWKSQHATSLKVKDSQVPAKWRSEKTTRFIFNSSLTLMSLHSSLTNIASVTPSLIHRPHQT